MATKNRNKRQSNSNRTEEKKNPLKRQKLHKAYYSAANVLWQLNEKSGSLNSLMNRFTGDKENVFFFLIIFLNKLIHFSFKNQYSVSK